jgi:predicted DNA-binding transcriptional regulator AlpA
MDEYISVSEASRIKHVSKVSIYEAIKGGRLPHVRILGKIGLLREDILNWEPTRYANREGAKGKGGRPKGFSLSIETKTRMSASQRLRWEGKRARTIKII